MIHETTRDFRIRSNLSQSGLNRTRMEPYLIEILDFIRFLETKALERKMELALASEKSLKKDWLKPEQNDALKDL